MLRYNRISLQPGLACRRYITKLCTYNIQTFFSHSKIEKFVGIFFDISNSFAQNVECGSIAEAVLMSTHILCFG